MLKKDLLDVLNLDEKASIKDIKNAYILLKNLYSENNIITESLENEYLDENRVNILSDIDHAYNSLMDMMNNSIQKESISHNMSTVTRSPQTVKTPQIEVYDGQTLRRVREDNNIDLEEISLATNIKRQYLINIENEDFSEMPPKVFIKGYLRELSRYLNIDEEKVKSYFLMKYDEWENTQ